MLSAEITFALIAASQGVFLAFMLLFKKRLHKGLLLSAYFGTFSLIILSWLLVWGDVTINRYPLSLHIPLQFLLGPLLLLYIRRNGRAERKYELAAPAVIGLVFCLYWTGITWQLGFTSRPDIIIPGLILLNRLSMISMMIYVFRLMRYQWSGHQIPLILSLVGFLSGNLVYYILQYMGHMTPEIDFWLVGFIFTIFYLSGFGYLVKSGQYTSSKSPDPQGQVILERIRAFFRDEPQYLKKGYRIEELAVQLGEPVSQVSRSIKEEARSNFKDFINQYRIEHAKELLLNSDLKIEAITDESGFSNKVSFIENFKKMEGVRPTEYRKNPVFSKPNRLD